MNTRRKRGLKLTYRQIAARADELWIQNGRPPTRKWDYWLQAECELRSRTLPPKAVKAANLMVLK